MAPRTRDAAARRLDFIGAATGLLMAGAVYAQRLPVSGEYLLPNRAGAGLVLALARLFFRPGVATAWSWLAMASCALCAIYFLWVAAKRVGEAGAALKKITFAAAAARAVAGLAGTALIAIFARLAAARWLDVIANAWFMPESLHPLEPLLIAGLFAGVFIGALRAACAFAPWALGGFQRDAMRAWAAPTARVVATAVLGTAVGVGAYHAGAPDLTAALGGRPLVEEPVIVAVYSGDDGGPQGKILGVGLASGEVEVLEQYLDARPRTVFTRAALRRLYTACALRMNAACLRKALSRGVDAGDPYARLLLLDHLQSASASDDARAALLLLSDETRWRAGAKASARLARAWARQGDPARAQTWLARASQGEGAIAPGLAALPEEGGPLRPGRVSGRVRVKGPAVVALYARAYETQPSLLGPGQLVGTTFAGKDGRFRFDGLSAGSYYFAVGATPGPAFEPRRARVLGRRGDVTLSLRRPNLDGVDLELRD